MKSLKETIDAILQRKFSLNVDCMLYISSHSQVQTQHCFQESNKVTDYLAKETALKDLERSITLEILQCIRGEKPTIIECRPVTKKR